MSRTTDSRTGHAAGLPPRQLFGPPDDLGRFQRNWFWLVVLGVGIMLAGVVAVGASLAATITTVLLFGVLLLAGGVAQLVTAALVRTWQGFFIHALAGVLYLLVGGVMVEHPLRAAAVLTLMLAVSFLIGGAARLLFAATHSFRGRGWVLVHGAVTLLLGLMIWQDWPAASLWVIGVFVGIDLLFSGWS